MVSVLVAEDDEKLNSSVCYYLASYGYEAHGYSNGREALRALEERRFDAIVTDIMMLEVDGFDLAVEVRKTDGNIPILFMTARDDMYAKEKGYKIGIDDYLIKPFDPAELRLRLGALLRRAKIEASKKIEVGNFVMNEEEHTAYCGGKEIALTVKEFDVLFRLLSFPKKTFSRSVLMEEFWGFDSSATSRAVDVCIAEIRKKIACCKEFNIVTVHGLGYKAVIK